jgi:hypothetical protein
MLLRTRTRRRSPQYTYTDAYMDSIVSLYPYAATVQTALKDEKRSGNTLSTPGVGMKERVRSDVRGRRRLIGLAFAASMPAVGAHAAGTPLEIDACALLRAQEISQVLSLPIEEGVRRDAGLDPAQGMYSSTCVWTVASDGSAVDPAKPLGGRSFVILNAMQWPRGSGQSRTFLDAFREAAASGEISSEPAARDFGDEALWWGDGLAVRRADVSFGVSVFVHGMKAERPGAFEERLAPLILQRLERGEDATARSSVDQ